jgi:S-methylmethionine-dependent homocysteine/selenocysteine methylase
LPTPEGRAALTQYFEAFLRVAKEMDTGFILDTVTWKAHAHWGRLADRMPWLNVFGGCCGSDLRHITEIAYALRKQE